MLFRHLGIIASFLLIASAANAGGGVPAWSSSALLGKSDPHLHGPEHFSNKASLTRYRPTGLYAGEPVIQSLRATGATYHQIPAKRQLKRVLTIRGEKVARYAWTNIFKRDNWQVIRSPLLPADKTKITTTMKRGADPSYDLKTEYMLDFKFNLTRPKSGDTALLANISAKREGILFTECNGLELRRVKRHPHGIIVYAGRAPRTSSKGTTLLLAMQWGKIIAMDINGRHKYGDQSYFDKEVQLAPFKF